MLPRAVTARVAYVPGTAFYADGFGSRHLRLSYCFPTPARILEGTRRLGDVLAHETELMSTFGTAVAGARPGELSTRLAPAPTRREDGDDHERDAAGPRLQRAREPVDLPLPELVVVLAGGLSHERDVRCARDAGWRRPSARAGSTCWRATSTPRGPRLAEVPGAVVFPCSTGRPGRTAPCARCWRCSACRSWAAWARPAAWPSDKSIATTVVADAG